MKARSTIFAGGLILAAGFFLQSFAQERVTIKKGSSTAVIKGSIGKFASKDLVFSYEGGRMARMSISSRNECAKFGGGETEMNLATQAGDNYIDLRNQCGQNVTYIISISFE